MACLHINKQRYSTISKALNVYHQQQAVNSLNKTQNSNFGFPPQKQVNSVPVE
jgi:hypothetical protein